MERKGNSAERERQMLVDINSAEAMLIASHTNYNYGSVSSATTTFYGWTNRDEAAFRDEVERILDAVSVKVHEEQPITVLIVPLLKVVSTTTEIWCDRGEHFDTIDGITVSVGRAMFDVIPQEGYSLDCWAGMDGYSAVHNVAKRFEQPELVVDAISAWLAECAEAREVIEFNREALFY